VERLKGPEVNGKNKLEYLTYFLFYAVFNFTAFYPISGTINNNNNLALCLFYMFRPLQGHHQEGIHEGIRSTGNFNMYVYRVKKNIVSIFNLNYCSCLISNLNIKYYLKL